ncbi:hypothetical protein B0H12DRAFT_1081481 [Mycena haematopus]|nr:hypothetical protein B0H12DRAFT_1081481 [Mycena haematopus]
MLTGGSLQDLNPKRTGSRRIQTLSRPLHRSGRKQEHTGRWSGPSAKVCFTQQEPTEVRPKNKQVWLEEKKRIRCLCHDPSPNRTGFPPSHYKDSQHWVRGDHSLRVFFLPRSLPCKDPDPNPNRRASCCVRILRAANAQQIEEKHSSGPFAMGLPAFGFKSASEQVRLEEDKIELDPSQDPSPNSSSASPMTRRDLIILFGNPVASMFGVAN